MNAKIDTCEIEGERVFRFTQVSATFALMPCCWSDTHRTIPAPVVEEVEEVIVEDESTGEAIYLWDSLNSSNA